MNLSRLFKGKKPDGKPAAETAVVEPHPAADQPARVPGADEIEQEVIEVLRTVYDPEIPVNIYELGLVYDIDVDAAGKVVVRMTLTSPGCPVAGSLIPEVESKALMVPGVTAAKVDLVWDPPWDPSKMTDAAKLQLGMF